MCRKEENLLGQKYIIRDYNYLYNFTPIKLSFKLITYEKNTLLKIIIIYIMLLLLN